MKIVVLDDSKTVLLTMQALLEELGASEEEIFLFSEGKKALSYIKSHGADIIFTDIEMPGMDGFEFVEKLLGYSEALASDLFVTSAHEHSKDVDRMKHIGAKRFIRKPIDPLRFRHFVAPRIAKYKGQVSNKAIKAATESVDVQDPEMIDYEVLAAQTGVKSKHIPRLIQSFITEAMQMCDHYEEAIVAKNYGEIAHCAHSIKGSAGNMQFTEVYEIAKHVERRMQMQDEAFAYAQYLKSIREGIAAISRKLPV
jgi:CheY-like chemotaxis protein